MRIKFTNTNPVDVVVDTTGLNKAEDKVIIHPKTTVNLTIEKSQYSSIKNTKGAVVSVLGGE